MKMMAKDPNERYQDPKEVVQALANCIPAAAAPVVAQAGQRLASTGAAKSIKSVNGSQESAVSAQTTRTAPLPGSRTPRPRKPIEPDPDAASIETKEIYADADTERPERRSRPKQPRPKFINSLQGRLVIAGAVVTGLLFFAFLIWCFN
jgi:hypothetical protein